MGKSVTRLVENSFPKFEAKKRAETMISSRYFYRDKARYGRYWPLVEGKDELASVKAITDSWEANGKEKSLLGKIMHGQIEAFYVHGTPLADTKECALFARFHLEALEAGYIPFRSEQKVFSKKLDIAGCGDMLYFCPEQILESLSPSSPSAPKQELEKISNEKEREVKVEKARVWLVDWKRTEEITKDEKYGFGLGLLSNKAHCNFEHYSLQLNIYKFLLERKYNMIVERMTIVALHPKQEAPLRYEVEDNQAVVAQLLIDNA